MLFWELYSICGLFFPQLPQWVFINSPDEKGEKLEINNRLSHTSVRREGKSPEWPCTHISAVKSKLVSASSRARSHGILLVGSEHLFGLMLRGGWQGSVLLGSKFCLKRKKSPMEWADFEKTGSWKISSLLLLFYPSFSLNGSKGISMGCNVHYHKLGYLLLEAWKLKENITEQSVWLSRGKGKVYHTEKNTTFSLSSNIHSD